MSIFSPNDPGYRGPAGDSAIGIILHKAKD